MNVATVAPLPAAALMRADAMRVLVLLRPTMARFAPSAASAFAAANPMPLVAPVIRICLSFTAEQSPLMAARPTTWMVRDLALHHGAPTSTESSACEPHYRRIHAGPPWSVPSRRLSMHMASIGCKTTRGIGREAYTGPFRARERAFIVPLRPTWSSLISGCIHSRRGSPDHLAVRLWAENDM
jgi:hypothetical protein